MITEAYKRNHLKPYTSIEGSVPGSYPSLGEIILRTYGLANPARSVAAECIPGLEEKMSIMIPVPNESSSSSQEGISTGRSSRNMI